MLKQNPAYATSAAKVLQTPLSPVQGKKDDPAHPAIYPTGILPDKLTKDQEKLYDLIVQRFFAAFMPDAEVENTTVTVTVGGHPFVARGQRTLEQGWLEFYGKYTRSSAEELPSLAKDEHIAILAHEKTKKMTKPPARYNPASVIKEMETLGIGTKATRANIVDTLYQRGYIKGREITVTEIGQKLVSTLEKYCPEIVSVELTKHFEEDMEHILDSKKDRETVLSEAKTRLREILGVFRKKETEIGTELLTALRNSENENLGKCPKCGKDLRVVVSRSSKKRFIGCSNYPSCKTSYPLPQKGLVEFSPELCPECGSPMIKGRRGMTTCVNMDCPGKKTVEREKEAAPQESS
jgi:DNA topoisomerase-1